MKKFNIKISLKWLLPFTTLIILLFILPIFFIEKENKPKTNEYQISLTFDEETFKLEGKESIKYYNNSENMFTHLYFHLYPNAFRESASAKVVASTNRAEAYPNGDSYGQIDINNVYTENGNLSFEIVGEDENILQVKLDNAIYPDESITLNIDFVTTLANINHRLGYGDNTINLGNFYPIACVYEDGVGFGQSLYHSNGDPFYSECANYQVTINVNSKFEVASSGQLIVSSSQNNFKQNTYKGENIRDFCLVLSEKFDIVSSDVDGVMVSYYGYQGDKNLNESLQTAIDALKTFNEMYGEYPYSQLSVVKSNFLHGGMEFPNIVLISDKVSDADYGYVIVHEIAHQWWYGVVGSDEYNHAWQDEGLAEYSTLLFYKKNKQYGEDFNQLINGANDSYKLFEEVYTKIQGSVDGRMDRPLCEFETEPEYVQCTYTKGVLLFNNISELISEKKFIKALKSYYKNYKYKIAKPEDLIAVFVDFGGSKMESIFNSWLKGNVIFK